MTVSELIKILQKTPDAEIYISQKVKTKSWIYEFSVSTRSDKQEVYLEPKSHYYAKPQYGNRKEYQ